MQQVDSFIRYCSNIHTLVPSWYAVKCVLTCDFRCPHNIRKCAKTQFRSSASQPYGPYLCPQITEILGTINSQLFVFAYNYWGSAVALCLACWPGGMGPISHWLTQPKLGIKEVKAVCMILTTSPTDCRLVYKNMCVAKYAYRGGKGPWRFIID